MNIFGRLRNAWHALAHKGPSGHPQDPGLAMFFAPPPTGSGVAVDEQTALTFSAYYACVRVIVESVAQLPLVTYRRLPDAGKTRAASHAVYPLLHDQPNEEMTAFQFREALTGHTVTWGNGYAEIQRRGDGMPFALWPLAPNRVRPERSSDGRLTYLVQRETGKTDRLGAMDVLHIAGLGFDGIVGYSPIKMHADAIGLGLATQHFGGRFFGASAKPGGILEHPGRLTDEAAKRLRQSWKDLHGGVDRSHEVGILEEGMKWHSIGIPPEEAQFLETRKFQATEMARITRVPPHMIGDLEKATFSNIEQQAIEFVTHTLMPWLVRWEQEIKRKLFLRGDEFFAEHLLAGLLRGDLKTRYEAYAIGRNWGWFSADDIRELENMNPLPGGKGQTYLQPSNMMPAGQAPPPAIAKQPEPQMPMPSQNGLGRLALVQLTLARCVRSETRAVINAAERPRMFLDFLQRFYPKHERFCSGVLLPVVAGLSDDQTESASLVALVVAELVRGREELLELAGTVTAAELKPAVERWAEQRLETVPPREAARLLEGLEVTK